MTEWMFKSRERRAWTAIIGMIVGINLISEDPWFVSMIGAPFIAIAVWVLLPWEMDEMYRGKTGATGATGAKGPMGYPGPRGRDQGDDLS